MTSATMPPPHPHPAFAIWLTGLPASGKSTIARALVAELAPRGVRPAVLESDALRKVLTPQPTYDAQERDWFYATTLFIGALLADHGVPVIFDATANRRAYRDAARARLPRFLEAYVQTPQAVCVQRDPKGIYRAAACGGSSSVPGVQVDYEPPLHPDLSLRGDGDAHASAVAVVEELERRGWV